MNSIDLNDFSYELPEDRIALYPAEKRDQSRLLFYNKGSISHHRFSNLPTLIPGNSILFFNDTKVIPARLHFKKQTGALIEIFLLNPLDPSPVMTTAMGARSACTWQCTIGNLKRWPDDLTLETTSGDLRLTAKLLDRVKGIVSFCWNSGCTFAEVITLIGSVPLPPYLHREADNTDRERYQTIYSHYEGAVAAPTAGLHFTESVLQTLKEKGAMTDYLTLHVGAGTFQPVKVEDATHHQMHEEQIIVSRRNIENLLLEDKFIVAVGTTSMRTLESLYWYGIKLMQNPESDFVITQNEPYQEPDTKTAMRNALHSILKYMDRNALDSLAGKTSIYILPGYQFRICGGLITNFHQPQSTLILLIAAFTGEDWKKIYKEALQHEYRFLSYGDSSFIIPT